VEYLDHNFENDQFLSFARIKDYFNRFVNALMAYYHPGILCSPPFIVALVPAHSLRAIVVLLMCAVRRLNKIALLNKKIDNVRP